MVTTSNSKRLFSSSSSSSSNCKWSYDVFLSFSGEDTRNSFTDHLYWALDRGNIKTFRDDEELPRGEEISLQLLKAIEESRIAIIVFSKTYARSKWCLGELVKIMECEEEKGQKVFPIFYHVEPSEVRNQTGIYGEAFKNHERNADEEKKKRIEEWKAALRKAGNLSGFPLTDGSESKFIEEIVDQVRRLSPKLVHVGENIVGIHENLEQVKLLIDTKSNEVSIVGIYGFGGIGKTTIAKVIYKDMLDQFRNHSFLENVRERSKDDHSLLQLQEKLLCDILMEKNLKLRNVDEGSEMIKSKCYLKKVLIVLDDVDCPRQLKFLAGSSEWFGRGSIIIITTRNKRCLDVHKVHLSYQAKGLANNKALELFCWNAFQQHHPRDNYVDLCNRVLRYAKGLPLALVVLGSFLSQRDEEEWESTLDRLKTIPLDDIQKVLQISYDGLDDKCKKLFLHIACFFKDWEKKVVTRVLEGCCRFHPKIELKVLDERCLISISNGFIRMHDLLQEMGWAIVRGKDCDNPEKWSRLWEYENIKCVLTKNVGTENIEGIFLNKTIAKPIQLHAKAFRKMNQLRLLKVGSDMVQLTQDFELSCRELTYFDWRGYPLESMPSIFHANNLVELHLLQSNVRHLWEENMHVGMLKMINLSHSKELVDISSILSAPNLEFLILEGCERLESLPTNLHNLKCLQTLSCADCFSMKSFPEMEENMRSLRDINFRRTAIIEVPSSIGHLPGLEYLDLSGCQNLLSLPESISNLSSLKTLRVENCLKLNAILLNVEIEVRLSSLQRLNLTCDFIESGVFWRNKSFSSLKILNPWCDQSKEEIVNHTYPPLPLSSLVQLCIINSSHCGIQNDSFCSSSLHISSPAGNYDRIFQGRIPSDIFNQSLLVNLSFRNLNLTEGRIPVDVWYLPSLESLSLCCCNLMEGDQVLNHVCRLSSLRRLDLDGSHFSSIPAGISQLSNLRILYLSHCKNLQQIPELPSSLRILDVHASDHISSSSSLFQFHSLIDWCKPELNQDAWINSVGDNWIYESPRMSITFPRSSGILEGINYQSTGSNEVTVELPPNWYENNDLLGFFVYCVYAASGFDFHRRCDLRIRGNEKQEDLGSFSYGFSCLCFHTPDSDISDTVWIMCYPKVAIKEYYRSNQRTNLMASFRGNGKTRVEGCGIHLIYDRDYEQMRHPSMTQGSSSHGNFGNHGSGSPTQDDYCKAHNKRCFSLLKRCFCTNS